MQIFNFVQNRLFLCSDFQRVSPQLLAQQYSTKHFIFNFPLKNYFFGLCFNKCICIESSCLGLEHISLVKKIPDFSCGKQKLWYWLKNYRQEPVFLTVSAQFLFLFPQCLCSSWPQSRQSQVTHVTVFPQCSLSTCQVPCVLNTVPISRDSWFIRKADMNKLQDRR